MDLRYLRNIPTISEEEQEKLRSARIAVVGCGGLGGWLIEMAVRLGIGSITAIDGDVFEESNLNRQLLSTEVLLGASKALAAAERARAINPGVAVRAVCERLTAENGCALVRGCGVVLDALDSAEARLVLEECCERENVPLVHGAIDRWNAQIAVDMPGDGLMRLLYGGGAHASARGTIACTPALCASCQMAEAVKLLCGRPVSLRGRLLLINLLTAESSIVSLTGEEL